MRTSIVSGFLVLISCVAASLPAQDVDIYDENVLRKVDLTFKQQNYWQLLTQSWATKKYIKADMKFLGKTYKDVGVRLRGNSSYKAIQTQKKPFKISMDAFVPDQRLYGYRTLNLNNGYRDPTWVREVIGFWMYRKFKPASRCNHLELTINGKSWGLYINVEQINKDFLNKWFESDDGNRYRGERQQGAPKNASALVWLGNNPNTYKNGYELKNASPTNPWVDIMQLCNVLNNTPANRLRTELPKALDTDVALWYLACNNVVPALDSYVGGGAHNYYIYNEPHHDRFVLMSWDLNANFGANGFALPPTKHTWDPFHLAGNANKPLMGKMFADVDWRAQYLAHIRAMLDEVYDWKVLGPRITRLQNLIRSAVQRDSMRLYSFSLFSTNVTRDVQILVNASKTATIPGLRSMVNTRRSFLWNHQDVKVRGPSLSNLAHKPLAPTEKDTVWITAKSKGGSTPVAKVILHWRMKGPYTETKMYDDGKHHDGGAGDGVFGVGIPKQPPNTRVQYFVAASASVSHRYAMTLSPISYAIKPLEYRVEWPKGPPSVRINEFVAQNTKGIKDQSGEYEDWIELFNPLGSTVNIGGMFMTDDFDVPMKWKIPQGWSLQPGASLLVWADEEPKEGPFHATFQLSSMGEEIGIFAADGKTLLDRVHFGPQQPDISTGRLRDGALPWVTYAAPTPLTRNAPLTCGTRRFSAQDPRGHKISFDLVGQPKLGNPVKLSVRSAPAQTTVFAFFGPGGGHTKLDGRVWLLLSTPVSGPLSMPIDAQGAFDLPFNIPNDQALAGKRLAMQVFGYDASGSQASGAFETVFCR